MVRRLVDLAAGAGFGAASGVLAGLASFVFLESLDRVTELRLDHPWLVWLLPFGGLVIGLMAHRVGGRASGGTALAVREARRYRDGAPALMAPLVLAGTLLGHLVGASVGREGTAVQMSASLTETAARAVRLSRERRALLARAAVAGGFGSVFGVPWAGLVFAFEVAHQRTARRLRAAERPAVDMRGSVDSPVDSPDAARAGLEGTTPSGVQTVVAAAAASFVGHAVVIGLGHDHAARPRLDLPLGPLLPLRLLIAAIVFGIAARVFRTAIRTVARACRRLPWPPLRPAAGGAATLAIAVLLGRDALGLSLPLVDDALAGADVAWWMPWLKLALTALALGSGFVGGEVTPLFVVGCTLGAVLAGPVGLPQEAVASLGFVAVFGAAARVPLTCAVLAAELFGWPALLPALVVGWLALLVAGRPGLYDGSPSTT